MFVRLEKIKPETRQMRFYMMSVSRTLFGEWCLIREWGRIGMAGGRTMIDYVETKAQAEAAMEKLANAKIRRGYKNRKAL